MHTHTGDCRQAHPQERACAHVWAPDCAAQETTGNFAPDSEAEAASSGMGEDIAYGCFLQVPCHALPCPAKP